MSPAAPLPTLDQLEELPVQFRATVGPEHLDRNGHMSTVNYVEFIGEAWRPTWKEVGIQWETLPRDGLSTFVAEQSVRFHSELLEGDDFSAYIRFVGRTHKAVHGVVFLVDDGRGRIATMGEQVVICVDVEARRPAPFPSEVQAALQRRLRGHQTLAWEVPVLGQVGARIKGRSNGEAGQ